MAYSTNVNVYYVDYAAGNDATGDGSSGTPWKTIQHACDNLVLGSKGALILLDTGADHVLATSLNVSTASPTQDAPLVIAGNGGKATVDLGASNTLCASHSYVVFVRIIQTNFSFVGAVTLGIDGGLIDCEADLGVKPVLLGTPISLTGDNGHVIRSSLRVNSSNTTVVISTADYSLIQDSFLVAGSSVSSLTMLYGVTVAENSSVRGNIFVFEVSPGASCTLLDEGCSVTRNIFNCTATGYAAIFLQLGSPGTGILVSNNYAEGFSGGGSHGFVGSGSYASTTLVIKENHYLAIPDVLFGVPDDIDSLQVLDNTIEASVSAIAQSGSALTFSNRFVYYALIDTDVFYTTQLDSIGAYSPDLQGTGAEYVSMMVA